MRASPPARATTPSKSAAVAASRAGSSCAGGKAYPPWPDRGRVRAASLLSGGVRCPMDRIWFRPWREDAVKEGRRMELRGNLRVSHKGRLGAGDRPAAFSPGGLVSGFLILCLGIHGPLSLALARAWAWR